MRVHRAPLEVREDPHMHLLLTEGAFRRDGTFVPSPAHDVAVLEEAWRRAVLAWFVAAGWLEEEAGAWMLAWPPSGFGAHSGPPIAGDDRAGLLREARYCALGRARRVPPARRR